MACAPSLETQYSALLMIADQETARAPKVGVLLLTDGCESEAIAELAASAADKAQPWSSISATVDQALTDAGLVSTAERVAIAVVRRRALAVQAETDLHELGCAMRRLWFGYHEAEAGRSTQLDSLMSEIVQLDDEWEATIIPERPSLVGELRSLVLDIVAYTTAVPDEPSGLAQRQI